jgi:regulator of RNase E activity RraA
MLGPNDVMVADMFGKPDGGIIGDNLATAIYAATKTGGLVVDGSIRDLEGIFPLDMNLYYRSAHPAAIYNVMVTGVNIPVRIGNATVMPGDIVFGDREGIYFVPPQFIQTILDRADETHVHDEWTKMKLMTGKYKSSEVYSRPKDPALIKEYEEYRQKKLGR